MNQNYGAVVLHGNHIKSVYFYDGVRVILIISLRNDKFLDLPKMKSFSGNKILLTRKLNLDV